MNSEYFDALDKACQYPNELGLARALLPFTAPLPRKYARRVLFALRGYGGPCDRADVVMMLRPLLTDDLLPELSPVVGWLHDGEFLWEDLLINFARTVPYAQIPRVLELARATDAAGSLAVVLYRLIPRRTDLIQEAIAAARSLEPGWTRAYLLTKLSEYDASLMREALIAANEDTDEIGRKMWISELRARFGNALDDSDAADAKQSSPETPSEQVA